VEIIETEVIRLLASRDVIVIAAGGGGIPVIESGGRLRGIDAVVDKDFASSLLARRLGADLMVIVTGEDMVYLDYGGERRQGIAEISSREMAGHLRQGQFPPGSMGPKIEAALEFLEGGGREVIITSPGRMGDALTGKAGTRIAAEETGQRPQTGSDT
jgi:carbamate kinase